MQIVWTDVGIAVVVVCDAARAVKDDLQIDPETSIGKNGISLDTIAGGIAAAYYYSCMMYVA